MSEMTWLDAWSGMWARRMADWWNGPTGCCRAMKVIAVATTEVC